MNSIKHSLASRSAAIDLLRLLAVLLVLADHTEIASMDKGWIGVDIFFVISGYVILSSLERRINSKHNYSNLRLSIAVEFALDRLVRLIPSLVLIVSIGLLSVALLDVPSEFGDHFLTGFASLTGQANIVIYNSSLDYFSPVAQRNIFMHLWSLGVEFQFYFFVAILCIFLTTFNIRIFTIIFGLISFLLWINFEYQWSYTIDTRFWEFSIGMLSFIVSNKFSVIPLKKILSLFGIIFIILALIVETVSYNILLSVFGSGIFLIGSASIEIRKDKILNIFTYLGRASYSIYLFHWIIIWLFTMTIGLDSVLEQTVSASTAVIIGLFSYRYFEYPIDRWWKLSKLSAVPSLLSSSTVTVCLWFFVSLLTILNHERISQFSSSGFHRIAKALGADIYTPLILSSANAAERMKPDKCHYSQSGEMLEQEFIANCLDRSDGHLPFYFLIGDSHASMISAGLDAALNEGEHKRFSYIHNNLFNLIAKDDSYIAPEIDYVLQTAEAGDSVMFTFYRGKINKEHRFYVDDQDLDYAVLENYLNWFLNIIPKLIDKDLRVILIMDGPRLALNGRADVCDFRTYWSGTNPCLTPAVISKNDRHGQAKIFNLIRERFPTTQIIDYHDIICEKLCSHRDKLDNLIMYDHNHISNFQSLMLQSFWEAHLH